MKSFLGRQGLTIALCLLILHGDAFAARSQLRAGHIRDYDFSSHKHDEDTRVIDLFQAKYQKPKQSLIKNADLVVSGNQLNRTLMSSRLLGKVSHEDHLAIVNAIQFGKPLRDLQSNFMKRASKMDSAEILEKLGDKVPEEVVAIVKSTRTQRTGQPFSEDSITKARNILNGMIYDAQLELDQKLIECKTFELMNKGNQGQVNNDLARLASQISDLAKMQTEARATIQNSDDEVEALEEKLAAETKSYLLVKAEDDIEMAKRKADVAIAEFIMSVTICEDKKPPAFAQKSSEPASIGIMKCQGDQDMFHFEDPKIEAEAQKSLTPDARKRLQKWLNDVHDHAMLQTGSKDSPDSDGDAADADGSDEPDFVTDEIDASTKLHEQPEVRSSSKQQPDNKAAEQPKHATALAPPRPPTGLVVAAKVAAATAAAQKPDSLMPPKCVLTKTNCGLLHDNMSILWGKWKDLQDELQAKMDEDKDAFEAMKKDLNQQKQTIVTAKGNAETSLAEAISMSNSDVEEQSAKQKELRFLVKQFNAVWGECKRAISEIVFTDICGVKKVRGDISKKSTKVGCAECKDQITDCEVDEWTPGLCSVECDDLCKKDGTKPDGSVCGGTQVLNRKVVVENNEYGVKCVPLSNSRSCSQILCPINCKMSPFSGFSKCTKECEGGLQSRTRSIEKKPKNGGDMCDATQEAQSCNTGSCTRDCTLKEWTLWGPCSQACGGGFQERFRHIKVPTRGDGKCFKKASNHRFQTQACNPQPCIGDEKCMAKMDVILAIDGSGSLRESGYQTLKDFAVAYVKRLKKKAYGQHAVKIGVVQFGNGQILKDKSGESTVSAAKMISGISSDKKKVISKIEATQWEKGFTNLAQVFATAEAMQMNGRKKAYTQIVIISDGKPSFKFSTKNEAQKLKDKGVNIFFININAAPNPKDETYLKNEIVSQPWKINYLLIPGLTKLKREMDRWVGEALVQTCPKALSPSQVKAQAEANGFKLIKEGMWCGETKGAKPEEDPLHEFMGIMPTVAQCMETVSAMEGKFFTYGTETGKKPNNQGHCYLEAATSLSECEGKWVKGPTNFYEVVLLDIEGEGEAK